MAAAAWLRHWPPVRAVAETSAALDGHAIAPILVVALLPARAVSGAVPRELHGPVASGVGTALASCAVGDAHPTLHSLIFAGGVGAPGPPSIRCCGHGGGGWRCRGDWGTRRDARGSGSRFVKFSIGPNTNSECSNQLN
jgi:hypothetical protein